MEVPNADLVGKYFVSSYYPSLFNGAHIVHQYYMDGGHLLHVNAGSMGNTQIAKSKKEIQRVLMSMDNENCTAEILTVDALDSLNGSVFVLVTGAILKGDITKKFVQSFFLIPKEGRFYVMNDICRYSHEETKRDGPSADNVSDGTHKSLQMVSSMGRVPEISGFTPRSIGEGMAFAENLEILDSSRESADSEQLRIEGAMYNQMTEAVSPDSLWPVEQVSLQDYVTLAPPDEVSVGKMSYAAILRLQSDSHSLIQTARPLHQWVSTRQQPLSFQHNSSSQLSPARPLTEAKQEPVPVEKVDLRSVFVKNLPANIIDRQLEDEMSRFGPLRPNRVSLKSNKAGLVYAFVDFEDSTSAQAAIEASPILIGGHKVYIEKRTSVYLGDRERGRGPRYRNAGKEQVKSRRKSRMI